jgi:uncharacterized membrane protein YfcA
MTPLLMLLVAAVMIGTAFLSGLFGMVGGMILIGVLLAVTPVPAAMVLHAVTQMASNGWRAFLWRHHIRWGSVFAFVTGSGVALVGWALIRYVPDKPMAFILLGVTPFLVRLVPVRLQPNPNSIGQGFGYGAACMSLMLLTGVTGPLVDSFFLGGGQLDRREMVATKAMCQVVGHTLKLCYFGGIVEQAAALDPTLAVIAIAASMLGTSLAKRFLEAMTDKQYRVWAGRLITTVGGYYVIHGATLWAMAPG